MYILELEQKNFRNLEIEKFVPHPKMNVICGENAQGKTNLLEAMWLFTGEKSFRGAKESEFANLKKSDHYELSLSFMAGERENNASVLYHEGKKKIKLNGVDKKGISAFTGIFCAVMFSPEHLTLIKGGPSERRNFIDAALCQIKPSYARLLFQYNHTLFQRNTLLKDIPKHSELKDTLDIWDERLAKSGSAIIKERTEYIKKLTEPLKEAYFGISGKREEISISYCCSVEEEEDLFLSMKKKLYRMAREDISLGFTSCGPHRDDLKFEINGISAREFGSQGQHRSLVLALKFAEAELLQRALQEPPVLFLDDVMSELDKKRQDYLLNHIEKYQVFITCCEPESTKLLKSGAVFTMKNGMIVKG